jgi:hypothetical protein
VWHHGNAADLAERDRRENEVKTYADGFRAKVSRPKRVYKAVSYLAAISRPPRRAAFRPFIF